MHKMAEMPYHIGMKAKIYPSREQKRLIAVNDGARRFVYNRLVANGNEVYSLKKVSIYCEPVARRLDYLQSIGTKAAGICNSAPFLYEADVDAQTIANAIKNYRTAWKNMKERHSGVPTFSKKSHEQHYQTNNHYKSGDSSMNDGNVKFRDNHHVQLPKLGEVRFDGSPKLIKRLFEHAEEYSTRIGSITISKDICDEYWAAFSIASDSPFFETPKHTGSAIGIDMNIDNFLADSNGCIIDNPKFLGRHKEKLVKLQHKLSMRGDKNKKSGRKLRNCRNYQKLCRKLAYEHRLIARQREDFHNRVSRHIIENQDYIAAEDLKTRNMLKNHRLARAISDVGWSAFLAKLEYKANVYGKIFTKVAPQNTTQTCSHCGHVMRGGEHLTLAERDWTCPECGTYHHRDVNSAVNILNRGIQFWFA